MQENAFQRTLWQSWVTRDWTRGILTPVASVNTFFRVTMIWKSIWTSFRTSILLKLSSLSALLARNLAIPWNDSLADDVTTAMVLENILKLDIHSKANKMSCDLGPKYYFSKSSIFHHMQNSHGRKKYQCNICDYKTAIKTSFKKHEIIHADKVECHVRSKQVTSLEVHKVHEPREACSRYVQQSLHQKSNEDP